MPLNVDHTRESETSSFNGMVGYNCKQRDDSIDSIPLYLVFEKSQLIEDVVWIHLGLIELTSTRYRHGILD